MQTTKTSLGELAAARPAATRVTDQGPWQDRLVDHHDYVWARLPFVVPMAVAVAKRRGDPRSQALARDLVALRPIVLDHLSREEQALALRSARAIRERLHADHVALAAMLAHLREEAADASTGWDQEAVERRLFVELAQLDVHLAGQIALEEQVLRAPSMQGDPT